MKNFETSINPIVNSYQMLLSDRMSELLSSRMYYQSGFDFFFLTKKKLQLLKERIEAAKFDIYHYSGSSREFLVMADDGRSIAKINLIEDTQFGTEPAYKMSYNSINVSTHEPNVVVDLINEMRDVPPSNMKVLNYYFSDGKLGCDEVLMDITPSINQLAYPYIPNINEYFDDYFSNQKSVLIFKGIPGTGKTNLIRNITAKYYKEDQPIYYTSSAHAIESDQLFGNFIKSPSQIIVFEDMDLHLTARNDGNITMYKLLATSDGYIKQPISSKKIIISTNIPNVRDFDEALMRKGRCHGLITFRKLNYAESCAFLESIGRSYDHLKTGSEYTLADLYND